MAAKKQGLWANIHAKQDRIAHGSGEHMRKPGSKGAPTAQSFEESEKSSKSHGSKSAAKPSAAKSSSSSKPSAGKSGSSKAGAKSRSSKSKQ